jgi:4-amino-4-deoxy-L-arabinose transferase-like glycosyltransferase
MRRTLGLLALLAVAIAYVWPMQVTGDNQNAHYALVKALARGVPYIDETLRETGDLQSHDVTRADGHLFAVKAPGLAMAAQPAYALVRAVGMRTTGDPMRVLWVLVALTSALATALLLLCVRDLGERVEPGFGAATAVVVGLSALTLPFATLFFSHALGTALVFASFWALWRERDGVRRDRIIAAAGVLAGLAITVEHPTMWIAPILALYAVARRPFAKRLGAFAAGGFVGVLPLLAFNFWALGNPLRTPYDDYWETESDLDALALPSWSEFSKIMFSSLGLLVLAPVLAAGVAGVVLLYRRGRRAEALVCAAAPIALVVYFSGPGGFGGLGPPRYLTPIVPFALLPLAAAFRRFPLTTLSLAAITVFQAVVQTSTGPLAAYDGDSLERLAARNFMSTAASLLGVTGWYTIIPFFLAAGCAVVLAAVASPRVEVRMADGAAAVAALAGWALVAASSTFDRGQPPTDAYVLAVFGVLAGAVALVVGAAAVSRSRAATAAA